MNGRAVMIIHGQMPTRRAGHPHERVTHTAGAAAYLNMLATPRAKAKMFSVRLEYAVFGKQSGAMSRITSLNALRLYSREPDNLPYPG